MPGVLKATFSSSTSESGSPSENEFWSSIEPGDKDYKYAAASYPEYNEKPLTEQLEPVAVCGMGM